MSRGRLVGPVSLTAAVLTCAVLSLSYLNPILSWGGDAAQYITQARAIVEGTVPEYVEMSRQRHALSTSWPGGPVAYPWGYPLLLAPFYAAFGMDVQGLKLLGVLTYLGFLGLLWSYGRDRHSPGFLAVLVWLFALNFELINHTNFVLSDIPFLFFSTLAVLLIQRWVFEQRWPPWNRTAAVLLGAAIAAAFFVRTNGVLLLLALGASQVWVARKRPSGAREGARGALDAKILLPWAAFMLVAGIWGAVFPAGGEGHGQAWLRRGLMEGLGRNIHYYLEAPGDFLRGMSHGVLFFGLSIPFALRGLADTWRRSIPALVFCASTVVLYLLYPGRDGLRYLFPVLPFYLSFTLSGVERAFQREGADRLARRAAILIVLTHVFVGLGRFTAGQAFYDGPRKNTSPTGPAATEVFDYIRNNTPPNAIVVFDRPRVVTLFTRRPAIRRQEPPWEADYVLVQLAEKGPAAGSTLVFDNGVFRLFEVPE